MSRCEIARDLLDSGADTEGYLISSATRNANTLWKNLLVKACSRSEENYLQVRVDFTNLKKLDFRSWTVLLYPCACQK